MVTTWIGLALWAVVASALTVRERRRAVLAARAGHEIRGPLCAARLALDGLERSARVAAIDLELRRAALALDDLAEVERGRRRGDRLEVVDVGRLLREAAPAWKALAAAHGGALAVESPATPALVLADRLRLTQACANLVANAIEHGGGEVRVRASTNARGVRVEVTDDGPGLPAPVAQLVAAARGRRTARGHGLAIAAAIAERHRGRLATAPSPHGARLVLELPPAPPPQTPPRTHRAATRRPPASAAPPSAAPATAPRLSTPAAAPPSAAPATAPHRALPVIASPQGAPTPDRRRP